MAQILFKHLKEIVESSIEDNMTKIVSHLEMQELYPEALEAAETKFTKKNIKQTATFVSQTSTMLLMFKSDMNNIFRWEGNEHIWVTHDPNACNPQC